MSGFTKLGDILPGWLMQALNFGMAYPKGDEDDLFALGDAWKQAAAALEKLEPELRTATDKVPQYYTGDGANAVVAEFAMMFDGKDYSIQRLVESLEALGHDARSTATDIEYTKIQSEIFALLTLSTVLSLLPTLWGSAAVPSVLAMSRVALGKFAAQMAQKIAARTAVAGARGLAKPLSREIAIPLVEKVAAKQTVKQLGAQAFKGAGVGAGLGGLMDGGIQLGQIVAGRRDDGFDVRQFVKTVTEWGAGGAIAAPARSLVGSALERSARISSRPMLNGGLGSAAAGLAGSVGMWGAGIGNQLYDHRYNGLEKVDYSFHKELLIGGLVLGGGGGMRHGSIAAHMTDGSVPHVSDSARAPETKPVITPESHAAGEKLFRDLFKEVHSDRLGASGLSADVQQHGERINRDASEIKARAEQAGGYNTDQVAKLQDYRNEWHQISNQGVHQNPVAGSHPASLHAGTPEPGRAPDTGTRTPEPTVRPASERPADPGTVRDGSTPRPPTADNAGRAAAGVGAAQHNSNIAAGTQDRPAPNNRSPEMRSATVSAEAEVRSSPAEPGEKPPPVREGERPTHAPEVDSVGPPLDTHVSDTAPVAIDSGGMGLDRTRVISEERLAPLEREEFQTAVQDALRDTNGGFIVGADPRHNLFGQLINDGGPHNIGRSNNCIEAVMAGYSSFRGDPQVAHPRWPDLLPDGSIDRYAPELDGLDRIEDWLGKPFRGFGHDAGMSVPQQYSWLHDQMAKLGEGAAAVVVTEWHATDEHGNFLYEPDGSPVVDDTHATLVVYPYGVEGPVWWDPQMSTYSNTPPPELTKYSGGLTFIVEPPPLNGGIDAGAVPRSGTGGAVSGSHLRPESAVPDSSDRARLGLPSDSIGAEHLTPSPTEGSGAGELRGEQSNGRGDSTPEPASADDRRTVRPGDAEWEPGTGTPDLPAPLASDATADRGNGLGDRVPGDERFPERSGGTDYRASIDHRQGNAGSPNEYGRDAGDVQPRAGLDVREPGERDLAGTRDVHALDEPSWAEAAETRPQYDPGSVAAASEHESAELEQIFHERIVPELLSGAASVPHSEKPELVVVGGQMGAGKSTMIAEIKNSFADRGGALHVSGDDFFRFHPRYAELMAQHDADAIRHIVPDAARWYRMALDHAVSHRQHVILELAMGDPVGEARTMRQFIEEGYTARAEVIAVPEPQSRLSTISRYLSERVEEGVHRYTPPRLHDASYTGSQEMVGRLESADPPVRVEELKIRSRSEVLFENARGADGQWTHPTRAAEIMAHERNRPWTTAEQRTYQEQLAQVRRRMAHMAELRPDESETLTTLGRELRETEEQARSRLEAAARDVQTHDAQQQVHATGTAQHEYLRAAEQRDLAEAAPDQHDSIRASYERAHELVDLAAASDKAALRILAVIDEWHPSKGGVVSVNKNLCEALAGLGHDVFVRVGHELTGQEGADTVTLIAPRASDPNTPLRDQLTSDMRDLPPGADLVIGHSRFSGPAAREIRDAVYPQATLVHIVHMVTDSLGRVQGKPDSAVKNHRIEADLVSTADVAVGVGPALAEEAGRLAAMTGSSPVLHQMIPGIEFFEQVRPPEDRQTMRMLVFGRADDPVKGAMQAAKMVNKLNARGIDVDLIVRGVPMAQLHDQHRILVTAAGRDVDVRPYTLDRDEILADMRDANVVLMPSRAEGFGLVATEAAGAGVPIVVPSTSGAGRFFADPELFPSELTAGMLVEQGYEEPVPVDRWVDILEHELSDQDGAWDRALRLQQILRERQYTWESAGAALINAAGMVPPHRNPVAGVPSDHGQSREPSESRASDMGQD